MELRIKEIAKSKNIDLGELAEKLNISRQSLYSRMTKNPSIKALQEIADVLDCDVHELIETTNEYSHFYDVESKEWLGIRKK